MRDFSDSATVFLFKKKDFLLLLGLMLIFRVVLAITLELFPDEAYYWMWSQRLSAGYLDHPPLVAWLIRLFSFIPGEIGLRIPALLGGVVMATAVFKLGQELSNPHASRKFTPKGAAIGAFAGMMVISIFPLNLPGLIVTPDTPLLALWATGMLVFYRAMQSGAGINRYWIALGVIAGLGLLAKYTMILFVGSAFIALLCIPGRRPLLAGPGPWAAAIIALLVFSPTILWNIQNEMASFRFQLSHGLEQSKTAGLPSLLEYLLTQFLMASPVAAFWMIWFSLKQLSGKSPFISLKPGPASDNAAASELASAPASEPASVPASDNTAASAPASANAAASAPTDSAGLGTLDYLWLYPFLWFPIFFFAITSLKSRVEANWPAPAWIAGSLIIAAGFYGQVKQPEKKRAIVSNRAPGFFSPLASLIVALILTIPVLFHSITFFIPFPYGAEPAKKLTGWQDLSISARNAISSLEKDEKPGPSFIITRHQQILCTLAWYAPDLPPVVALNRLGDRARKSAIPVPITPLLGRNALTIVEEQHDFPEEYDSLFKTVDSVSTVDIIRNNRRIARYYLRYGRYCEEELF